MYDRVVICIMMAALVHGKSKKAPIDVENSPFDNVKASTGSQKEFLFDLSTDLIEDTNLANDDEYQEEIAMFEDLYEYWSDLTIADNDPDFTNKISAFDACGRVCPWISDDLKDSKPKVRCHVNLILSSTCIKYFH